MANPQFTITLGRSGQRVVKESWGDSDRGRADAPVPSGGKRSFSQSFDAHYSLNHSKRIPRIREDVGEMSYGYNSNTDDTRTGAKDLRMKLMRKRMSKRMELEDEECKKVELHEKVSRAIESLDKSLLGSRPSLRRAAEQSQLESMRSPYPSWTSYGARVRSPERIPRFSSGISTPRGVIDEQPQVQTMRQIDASRTGLVFMSDPLESSRPKVPLPTTSLRPLDAGKMVTGHPTANGDMARPAYPENQPLTVGSFLNSIGLGKYSISFQAEEIDMVALTQMGDADLKELGIAMGPRKKIILALQARMKRPVIQSQGKYVQIMKL
ncbi:hypothetical protein BUALT_Bualt04G0154200 [Buddleja alternifolia]|uniref:SAM domain-containing protein n=1 Tax=Buddleja alternifolia TaxID=168488 RepID=A0AAV6XW09_9LAMI|nr:hypothetical protein BUALT_Bualt04G0154200 [Buddleja alternifolia]